MNVFVRVVLSSVVVIMCVLIIMITSGIIKFIDTAISTIILYIPSKFAALAQRCFTVGPSITMLAQQ